VAQSAVRATGTVRHVPAKIDREEPIREGGSLAAQQVEGLGGLQAPRERFGRPENPASSHAGTSPSGGASSKTQR
jgi:hypothetical protein